jgi:hypothetical protein
MPRGQQGRTFVPDATPEREAAVREQVTMAANRKIGLRLLPRLLIYHGSLVVLLLLAATLYPGFIDQLPVGGIKALAESGDVTVVEKQTGDQDLEIVQSFIQATSQLDRLGYARQLVTVLVCVSLLMLPVSWVYKGIHRNNEHDHSLDETALILPGVVAALVLVVQHSLALAFSLAGIVAGVHFRRSLQDTYDALFILVAIGAGMAAGVSALEITAVLTVFFCYGTVLSYFVGDGLQSDFDEQKKIEKRKRKDARKHVVEDDDDD